MHETLAVTQVECGRSVVMWHSFSELQMLLRLDFPGTAAVRKDELIRTMWDKGDLKPNVSVYPCNACSGASLEKSGTV